MAKIVLIVLDGVGVGEAEDAKLYNDIGTNTLSHVSYANQGFSLPNMEALGLGYLTDINGVKKTDSPEGNFGKLQEKSIGKDSISGHWEIGGHITKINFPMFYEGFPEEMLTRFLQINNLKGYLGNKAASGTEIIEELGNEHCKTGFPIIYTSLDSVFQIAAHEDVIPLEKLYSICEKTRNELLVNDWQMARVIARPFLGTSGKYFRTPNRKDYSVEPTGLTMFDYLSKNKIDTYGVGKIGDLYAYRGIKFVLKTKSNLQGIEKTIELSRDVDDAFIMTNLVDFDQNFGHRNDPAGFAEALYEFDSYLPEIKNNLDQDDILIITADHGNDPTTKGTDHTREYTPLLVYGKNIKHGISLGIRESFADIGKTVLDFYKINNSLDGISFLNQII